MAFRLWQIVFLVSQRTHKTSTAQLIEVQSPDVDGAPSVVDSILDPLTNPQHNSDVQVTSPVFVGTAKIVTVDVHAAWDAEENRLPDPLADGIEAQRSSPGVDDIQQLTYDRTHDLTGCTDGIERNPTAATESCIQQENVRQVETLSADVSYVDLDSICAAQAEDDSIKVMLDYLSSGEGLHSIDIRQYPEEARQLFGRWESLVIRDGVYHTDGVTKFLQVVLLAVLRRSFVEKLHAELGHFGRAKTALAVSRRAYFPAWRSFTHLVARNCSVCNRLQRSKQPQKQTNLKPMTKFRPSLTWSVDSTSGARAPPPATAAASAAPAMAESPKTMPGLWEDEGVFLGGRERHWSSPRYLMMASSPPTQSILTTSSFPGPGRRCLMMVIHLPWACKVIST